MQYCRVKFIPNRAQFHDEAKHAQRAFSLPRLGVAQAQNIHWETPSHSREELAQTTRTFSQRCINSSTFRSGKPFRACDSRPL